VGRAARLGGGGLALVVGASCLLGPAASAAEVSASSSVSLPLRATSWADSVALPRFTSPPSPSSVPDPEWLIAAEPGATTRCRLDEGPWIECDGSFTTFAPGRDGTHVLRVVATDAVTFEVDEYLEFK